jgi:hypothetical protein
MEKKRYQVFVSSTYVDLKEERAAIFDALSKMDCIPAGMEIFPAIDEQQLDYIKSIIDDSDYYIVVIGGRYGSVTAEGVSFTEKEFDYAISKGIPVLSFIHGSPDNIPVGDTDKDESKRISLDAFIKKAQEGRLTQSWNDVNELKAAVMQAVMHNIKVKPGVGWIRGNVAASVEILNEINELRKEKEALVKELADLNQVSKQIDDNLAPLDAKISLRFRLRAGLNSVEGSHAFTWAKIFSLVGPEVANQRMPIRLDSPINTFVSENNIFPGFEASIFNEDRETIKWHLIACGLLEIDNNNPSNPLVRLTRSGSELLIGLKAART